MGQVILEGLIVVLVILVVIGIYQKLQEINRRQTEPDPSQFQMFLDYEEDGGEMIVLEFREGKEGRTRPLAEGVYEIRDTTGGYVKRLEIRTERFLPWLRDEQLYEMPVLLSKLAEPRHLKLPRRSGAKRSPFS